ncbi:MAG: TatD family hydrolase [Paludibacteraceae bacterium]|nr:TatD family hydrolase [Paludibacteraceae bacterium]
MIDTHAHIDDPQYASDFLAFLDEQRKAGVEAVVVPGVNVASVETVMAVCNMAPAFCFPALGLHPEDVKDDWQKQLAPIEQTLGKGECVAVGEIGLDYYWDKTYIRQQKEALAAQLELALQLNLPVLLHNRDATEDMLQMLLPFSKRGLKGVMHCFTGSRETAERILKMGLFLGIGGVLTFKNSHLPDTLRDIPLEKIVLETDSPYMAPVPFRGKRNEPKYIRYVIERLTEVYHLTYAEIEEVTSRNARLLLGLE